MTKQTKNWILRGAVPLVVVALIAGLIGIRVASDDSKSTAVASLPKLPGASSGGGQAVKAMSADSSFRAASSFKLADNLAALPTSAPAYTTNLGDAEAFANKLRDAFGATGDIGCSQLDPSPAPPKYCSNEGAGGTLVVGVTDDYLLSWNVSKYYTDNGVAFSDANSFSAASPPVAQEAPTTTVALSTNDTSSSDKTTGAEPEYQTQVCPPLCGGDTGVVSPETSIPALPQNLPSDDDAKARFQTILNAAGIDTDHGFFDASYYGPVDASQKYSTDVRFTPTLDGLPVWGAESYISFGADSEVLYANGYKIDANKLGDYPLATYQRALDRANASSGCPVNAECMMPMIAQADDATGTFDSTPQEPVVLDKVELGLSVHYGEPKVEGDVSRNEIYLVPAFRFSNGDGVQVVAEAAADEYIDSSNTATNETTTVPGAKDPTEFCVVEPAVDPSESSDSSMTTTTAADTDRHCMGTSPGFDPATCSTEPELSAVCAAYTGVLGDDPKATTTPTEPPTTVAGTLSSCTNVDATC